MRIATRQAFRRLAQRRPTADLDAVAEPVLADTSADPTRVVVTAERRSEIREAVAALPDPYRETVALRFFGELSLAEIAETTGRPLNTVKTHLRRGLERLRADAGTGGRAMIRHPYGPDELDRSDSALDAIAERLQAFASDERSGPPIDLAARIHAAVDAAPDPAVGWWAPFTGPVAPWSIPARGIAAAAVVAAAVVTALAVGDLADLIRGPTRRAGRRARRSPSVQRH